MELKNYLCNLISFYNPDVKITNKAIEKLSEIFRDYTNFHFERYKKIVRIIDIKVIDFILYEGYREHKDINCYFHSEIQILKDVFKDLQLDFIFINQPIGDSETFYYIVDKWFLINRNALIIYQKHVETYFINFIKLCLLYGVNRINMISINYAQILIFNRRNTLSLISTDYHYLIPYIKKINNHLLITQEVYEYINLILQNLLIKIASICSFFKEKHFTNRIATTQSLFICMDLITKSGYDNVLDDIFTKIDNYQDCEEIQLRSKKADISINVYCIEQILSKYFNLNHFSVELRVSFAIFLDYFCYELFAFIENNTNNEEISIERFKNLLVISHEYINIIRNIGMTLDVEFDTDEDISENYTPEPLENIFSEYVTDDENEEDVLEYNDETVVDSRIIELEKNDLISNFA